VKVVALIVAGSIARLNVAVITLPPPATPFVLVVTNWLPLVGAEEITVGMVAPTATVQDVAPGTTAPAGAPAMVPATPPLPPPPPHPAAKALNSNTMTHDRNLE